MGLPIYFGRLALICQLVNCLYQGSSHALGTHLQTGNAHYCLIPQLFELIWSVAYSDTENSRLALGCVLLILFPRSLSQSCR